MRKISEIGRINVLKVFRFKLEMMHKKGQVVVAMKMMKKKSNHILQ
jgi:hypothetical protein